MNATPAPARAAASVRSRPRPSAGRWHHVAGPLAAATVLALTLTVSLTGCIHAGARLEYAHDAYAEGDYQRAYNLAVDVAHMQGIRGEHAAYIAGLSADRLDRPEAALRHLQRASRSRDRDLAADALASLGLVHQRQGQHRQAADALERAADLLAGEQRAQALFHAGIAHQKLDRWSRARQALVLARAATNDPELRQQIERQLEVTGYTIQLGAFTDADNARTAAHDAADRVRDAGLGDPRLVELTDREGRDLTVIQAGRFSSFNAALDARQRLGATDSIIVPLIAD